MPLDPLVKAFLDKAAAIPRPKAWDVPPAMARQSFAGMMQLTGPKDVPVGKIDNFVIPGPGGDIRARAYGPIAAVGPQPALIYFHGGGFVVGGLESHDGLCRLFTAEGGFKVIAVDYRLAPEHPFPAAVDDAWAAFQWIEANAFDLLRDWSDAGEAFDTIVLDPPAFAKSKRAVDGALRGYKEMNLRALKMLRPGGRLVTCSCPHHVPLVEFQAAVSARRSWHC